MIAAPAWDTPPAPAPSVTAAPPPAAAPFGSPTAVPPPGFVESPSVQRNPVVVLGNLEGETFTLTLQGPVQYRVVVAPYSHRQFQVLPGTYAVSLECETALPNSGWGIFREYCRYTATACKEASSRAEPLRMGDLAQ